MGIEHPEYFLALGLLTLACMSTLVAWLIATSPGFDTTNEEN